MLKEKKIIITIALAVVVILAVVIVEEIRLKKVQHKLNEIHSKLTARVLNTLRVELEETTMDYEQGTLTDEKLSNHYDQIAHYAMSLHILSPDEFFPNINAVNIINRLDKTTFNEDTYNQYIKIIGFLDYTNYKIEENHSDTEWLDYYDKFTDVEFNNQFKILIEALISKELPAD